MSDHTWKKIENQISVLLENHTIFVSRDIRNYLDKIINNYIGKQIIKKNPRIMNNLLFLLLKEYPNYSVLLRKFLEKIDEYHIPITEEYYQVLKEQDGFRKILIYLDCEDLKFAELKDYLKKLHYYKKIKVHQKSFRVCKNIFESYFSLLSGEHKHHIFKHFDAYVKKFKYLITQEDVIEDIVHYCQKKYTDYPIEDFRLILFTWNKEKVDALINEYRSNESLVLDNLKKYDYLLLLIQDVHRLNTSGNMKLYTFNEEIKEVKELSNNLKTVNDRRVRRKTLYEYIGSDSQNLTDEDKRIIDILFSKLSKERKENIQNYLDGLFSSKSELGRKAFNDFYILRLQFRRYKKTESLDKKSKKRKDFYEYFVVDRETLSEEDKKIIDTLFSKLSEERRENIQNYLKGLFSSRSELGKKVFIDILILQQQFRRYKKTGTLIAKTNNKKKKNIYEYFEVDGKTLSEEDKKIIDTLFSRFSKERQENIQNYLSSLFSSSMKLGIRAKNDISIIRRQFRRYQETGTLDFQKVSSILSCEEKRVQEQFKSFRKVHLQKYRVLLEALKIVEESFYRLGCTHLEYQTYKQSKEQELISRGVLSDLDFLSTYISESVLFIKEEQSKFSKI